MRETNGRLEQLLLVDEAVFAALGGQRRGQRRRAAVEHRDLAFLLREQVTEDLQRKRRGARRERKREDQHVSTRWSPDLPGE